MARSSTSLFNCRLARVIVILLVLYAGFDIANPQLCGEEFTPGPISLSFASEESDVEHSTSTALSRNEREEQSESPSKPHNDEDCFCCCTHVLPGLTSHPNGSLDVRSGMSVLTRNNIVSVDLKALYHPPRIA